MLIGITGGIGSGKSVVSRILRLKGRYVYDCDSEAKRIMEESTEIKCRIRDEISEDVTDGLAPINRSLLAQMVFSDAVARKRLNAIVHQAVRKDVRCKNENIVMWVESAILAESGLADMCDRIWRIEVPKEVRIANIISRDNCSIEQAKARIHSQAEEERLIENYLLRTDIIHNDSSESVIEQIDNLLISLKN